jgi:hypothetical protein
VGSCHDFPIASMMTFWMGPAPAERTPSNRTHRRGFAGSRSALAAIGPLLMYLPGTGATVRILPRGRPFVPTARRQSLIQPGRRQAGFRLVVSLQTMDTVPPPENGPGLATADRQREDRSVGDGTRQWPRSSTEKARSSSWTPCVYCTA